MPDGRVTVYRFDPLRGYLAAGYAIYRALADAEFDARLVLTPRACLVDLPPHELPALRELQRDEPGRFGGC